MLPTLLLLSLGCSGHLQATSTDSGAPESGCNPTAWYRDEDGDGFGADAGMVEACQAPIDAVDQAGDCDDSDEEVHPGALHECRVGRDLDCDGAIRSHCGHSDGDLILASEFAMAAGTLGGDQNGDGRADIAVSGYYANNTPGYEGYIDVFLDGASTGTPSDPLRPNVHLTNVQRGYFGDSIVWLSDMGGDGGSELAVWGYRSRDDGSTSDGHVQLVFSSEPLGGGASEGDEPRFGIDPEGASHIGPPIPLGEDPAGAGQFAISFARTGYLFYGAEGVAAAPGWNEPSLEHYLAAPGTEWRQGAAGRVDVPGFPAGLFATTFEQGDVAELCLFDLARMMDGNPHDIEAAEVCTSLPQGIFGSTLLQQASDLDGDGEDEIVLASGADYVGDDELPKLAAVFSTTLLLGGSAVPLVEVIDDRATNAYVRPSLDASTDLDGGGRADLFVTDMTDYGDSEYEASSENARVLMFSGETLPWGATVAPADASIQWTDPWWPENAIVSGGGDFNGDGRDDVLMSLGTDDPDDSFVLFGW